MKRKQVYEPPEVQLLIRQSPLSLLTSLSASADVGDFGREDSYAGDFGGEDSSIGGFGGSESGAGKFGSGTW